ncbi:MAG: hypothetical protein HY308_01825 [Gammaproteobacteria bacterium]|nr:hypothetical protein [Gammaproteobacteria bacterium]
MSPLLSIALEKAKDLLKDKLKEKAKDYAGKTIDENLSLGSQALEDVKKDIAVLEVAVSEYDARFQTARAAIMLGVVTDQNYHSTCVRIYAPSEAKKIDELIEKLREAGNVTDTIETRAMISIDRQIDALKRTQKAKEDELATQKKSRVAKNQSTQRVEDDLRMIYDSITRHRVNRRLTEDSGNKLQAVCQESIQLLTNIRNKLLHEKPYVYFAKQCDHWLARERAAAVAP